MQGAFAPYLPTPLKFWKLEGSEDLNPQSGFDQCKVTMFPSWLKSCPEAPQLTQHYVHLSIFRYNFVLPRRYKLSSPAALLPSEISWKVSCCFGVAIWRVKQLNMIPLKYHSIRSFVIHTTERDSLTDPKEITSAFHQRHNNENIDSLLTTNISLWCCSYLNTSTFHFLWKKPAASMQAYQRRLQSEIRQLYIKLNYPYIFICCCIASFSWTLNR